MEESICGTNDESIIGNSYQLTLSKFKNSLETSVKNILEAVTDDMFISIYKKCYQGFEKREEIERPSLSGSSVEARKLRKQLNDITMKTISESLNETMVTLNMATKLNKLEELKRSQKDTLFSWRPPGDVSQHITPFDSVSKLEEKKELESLIKKEMEEIDLLKARLIQKRLKAKELHETAQLALKKIENSVVTSV